MDVITMALLAGAGAAAVTAMAVFGILYWTDHNVFRRWFR